MSSSNAKKPLAILAALFALAGSAGAHAQSSPDPDLRNLEPLVMVIVDTSGSMERKPGCTCTTPGCLECLPNCPTTDTPVAPAVAEKNRWSYVLEALTGTFTDFRCNELPRTTSNGATYDQGYFLPYHQPWHCASGSAICNTTPPYPTTVNLVGNPTAQPFQGNNGVMDSYAATVRFGLMTFDGMETYRGANPLIHQSAFDTTLSNSVDGMWSYAGPHQFHYPNCTEDYAMDTGARSPVATEGALISVNSCTTPPCDMFQLNANIQDALLRTRPFGGTPIAASLDDLYYHFKNDLTDQFGGCRDRYALLLTDGFPDDDYRSYGCDCKKQMNCPPMEDPNLMKCPYPLASDVAHDLVTGRSGDTQQMKQLFVVGIGVNTTDTATRAQLNLIASQGGSVAPTGSTDTAIFVDDSAPSLAALSSSLDRVLGGLSNPVSRSVPAFATSATSAVQYQVSAGFQKALGVVQNGIAPPWTGIIERERIGCNGIVPAPLAIDPAQGDRFQDTLNGTLGAEQYRHLWTALPQSTSTSLNASLDRVISGSKCGSTFCTYAELNTLAPDRFGLVASDTATRDKITDWMYGRGNSVRANKRLADVYHSSPTIPRLPLTTTSADSSYTTFLQRSEIQYRPLAMYIGTNDGILHAFSLEAYNGTSAGNSTVHPTASYIAGQEMWGFVPPMKMDELEAQLHGHQFSMDGTPVVKDAFFKRVASTSVADYHTVLVTGMRRGGDGYVALDVSDPISPKFLWQFTRPDIGFTYGKPVITQATFAYDDGSGPVVQDRGIVILSGGSGLKGSSTDCGGSPSTPTYRDPSTNAPYGVFPAIPTTTSTPSPLPFRSDVPCWKGNATDAQGRVLYFVDLESGSLIKEIRLDNAGKLVFPSPVIGTPTVYPDTVGLDAKEGFVMDADGVIWRIDINATTPGANNDPTAGWTVRPFYDMFVGGTWQDGETSYETPILSFDDAHRLVVIAGTGDTDNFDKPTVKNRVASVTEVTVTGSGPDTYKAALNWQKMVSPTSTLPLVASELVTGSMALFQGRLFFATFISVVNSANACDFGRGRLWSVDYHTRDTNDANGDGTFGPLLINLSAAELNASRNDSSSGVSLFNVPVSGAADNEMVLGLGATQPPLCTPIAGAVDTYFSQAEQKFIQSAPPSIWIVAQASGGRTRSGSALGSIRIELDRKSSFSKVASWASSTD